MAITGEPGDTFDSLFGNSINQVRRFTHAPILISETAVGPATGNLSGDIGDLFDGIHRDHLLGPVWFDVGGPQSGRTGGSKITSARSRLSEMPCESLTALGAFTRGHLVARPGL